MGLADRDYMKEKIKEIEERPKRKKKSLIFIIIAIIMIGLILIDFLI